MKQNLDFDSLKKRISEITDADAKAQSGIFSLEIVYRKKVYRFSTLKESHTLNPDNCGFSRNHYYQEQPTRESIFHDREDVDVTIWREQLVSAEENRQEKTIHINTTKWKAVVNY